MSNKKGWLSFETVGSVCAMLLSIVAVYIAWEQSMLMREQNHASVWPIVDVEVTLDRDDTSNFLSIDMKNVGVGPAMVQFATITVNGNTIQDYGPIQDEVFVPALLKGSMGMQASSFVDVLGAGDIRNVLRFNWGRTEENDAGFAEMARKFLANPDLLDIEICFCSVFERCWQTADDTSLQASRVESCPIQERDLAELIIATAAQTFDETDKANTISND